MENKSDMALKCLQYLLNHSGPNTGRTERSLVLHGNPPEAAALWKPNDFSEILETLNLPCGDTTSLEAERRFFSSAASPTAAPTSATEAKIEGVASAVRKPATATVPSASIVVTKAPRKNRNIGKGFNPPRKIASPPQEVLPSPRAGPASGNFNKFVQPVYPSCSNGYDPAKSLQGLFTTVKTIDTRQKGAFSNQSKSKQFEDTERDAQSEVKAIAFKTARQQLIIEDRAKGIKRNLPDGSSADVHVSGLRKAARYAPPAKNDQTNNNEPEPISDNPEVVELMENPLMKNIDVKMVETVLNEVFDTGSVDWKDIAGLESVKNVIKEIIIWPMLRPDIFTGLRGPPKGILLFGPPGTGKTMMGKLIATQSKSAFFNISASSLTSKWIGDGEKMVRALFAVARVKQPAVIFIDEIDSILTQRSDTEHESSRRLKTEFLIQFDGCGSKSDDRILVIGVTNRPQELDDAARRRLVKRIYIPLPDVCGRKQLVQNLLKKQNNSLTDSDYDRVAEISEGYSGADMATLCQEASYGPIRDEGVDIQNICADQVRPMTLKDFETAIRHVKASVAGNDLKLYQEWDEKFGCHL